MARTTQFVAASCLAAAVVGGGIATAASRPPTVLLAHGIPRDAVRVRLVAFALPVYAPARRPARLHLRPAIVHPHRVVVVRRVISVATAVPAVVRRPAPPKLALPPRISGVAAAGESLAATPARFAHAGHARVTRIWLRCNTFGGGCNAIPDAAGPRLQLGTGDVGHTIRIAVTATAGRRSATGLSDATAVVEAPPAPPQATVAPSILGFPASGSELTADPGTWTPVEATLALQWKRCDDQGCAPIDGATGPTYDVDAADVGFSIELEVTATDAVGATTADSAAVAITS